MPWVLQQAKALGKIRKTAFKNMIEEINKSLNEIYEHTESEMNMKVQIELIKKP